MVCNPCERHTFVHVVLIDSCFSVPDVLNMKVYSPLVHSPLAVNFENISVASFRMTSKCYAASNYKRKVSRFERNHVKSQRIFLFEFHIYSLVCDGECFRLRSVYYVSLITNIYRSI